MGVLFIWYRKGVAERLPFQREGRVKQILIMTGEEKKTGGITSQTH